MIVHILQSCPSVYPPEGRNIIADECSNKNNPNIPCLLGHDNVQIRRNMEVVRRYGGLHDEDQRRLNNPNWYQAALAAYKEAKKQSAKQNTFAEQLKKAWRAWEEDDAKDAAVAAGGFSGDDAHRSKRHRL